MNQTINEIYEDLIAIKEDLEEHLNTKQLSEQVKRLAEEDLQDINWTLAKWRKGHFGFCEETGIPLPKELLIFQPTVKTMSEVKEIVKYLRKPVFPIG